jgi:hypothetical protein
MTDEGAICASYSMQFVDAIPTAALFSIESLTAEDVVLVLQMQMETLPLNDDGT